MIPSEIEQILGAPAVRQLQNAVESVVISAEQHDCPIEGMEAVRALLVSMLAATVITPTAGAAERAGSTASQLIDVVNAALKSDCH